eukprot:TRINITY_DN9975_c0_g1_i2.p1 TRINITY_DN9975_c0_g1~~TRINITY_DN9975_c0_g1_i2.p1  ORF type:complete len:1448 (+),score=544.92 TRINITY_DN9975_c0_g1_i2:47-4390(+)
MEVENPPNLGRCTVHVVDQTKRTALLGLLVLLYAVALQWAWSTMGDPYSDAVEEARRIHDSFMKEEAKKPKRVEWVEDEEEEIFDIDSVEEAGSRGKWKADEADYEDIADTDGLDGADDGSVQFDNDDTTNTTMAAKLRKALPSETLPSAGAASMLFLVVTCNALFFLLCHWYASFKAATQYSPAKKVTKDCHVLVMTLAHHGEPGISKIFQNEVTGDMTFCFQRRNYIIKEEDGRAFIVPVSPPTTDSVQSYVTSKGLEHDDVEKRFKIYGENRLSIVPPTLFTMWRQQLLSPIPVFQFFSSVLWMLDEYWQYTFFTFFTIMLLEFGTAFQRLRTLGQLTKMSMKPTAVLAFRDGKWMEISSLQLLPGDIISLAATKSKDKQAQESADVIPCDCLLLGGSAIVNEASLTGESVPAMKDAAPANETKALEMEGVHRIHTLFSGTTLVDTKEDATQTRLPKPSNNGIICCVLRTGFGSSQGGLMQMIEFSTEGVTGDSRETFYALLFLLAFAIIAAVYVFQKGLAKGDRTTHELLVKSVLIITSVVPRQLPMQMALAVNTALMALVKAGVMCTEPFRVPLAGKISHTLFDKTGTLTTDTLIPAGIVNADKSHELMPVNKASEKAAIILAGCHSLVASGDDETSIVGDPIEVAAIRGIEWRYDVKKQTASRGNWEDKEKIVKNIEMQMKAYKQTTKRYKELAADLEVKKKEAKAARDIAESSKLSVQIKHRFHFSSKLQRMSVIAEVRDGRSTQQLCLVKGSPEALSKLLNDSKPDWFTSSYTKLMEQGMRVLALGYKPWDGPSKAEREQVESNLTFAGFIAFSCRIRNDTPAVVRSLKESDHSVVMVTGDGLLTALHVAKEVGITNHKESFTLEAGDDNVAWVQAIGEDKARLAFDVSEVADMHKKYDLLTTEDNLCKAADIVGEGMWSVTQYFKVFARMSPNGKAKVIRSLQERQGAHVLMCGDGSNDVGALKQADVGLALLSGYGNANTGDEDKKDEADVPAEVALNRHQQAMDEKAKKVAAEKRELMKQKQQELSVKQRQWLEEEIQAREARGEDTGVFGQMAAMKVVLKRFQDEMKKEEREVSKVGNVFAPTMDDVLASAEMDSLMIRPGDASVAASFTSRLPTIKSTVDLIRQGRCTLLSALQQQQIMMLESLISAFTLSALSLEGARQSERQMMASGWLLSIATLSFSYATPVDRMHPERPLRSLFHPAIFISMAGQAVIHIGCMYRAVQMATDAMGPEELASVVEFHRKAKLNEIEEEVDPDDPLAYFSNAFWSTPFKPNLLNTVVFLVETAQIIAVLFVNYKGRPWMKGLSENHALFLSLFITFAGIAYVAWAVSPELNAMLHFAPFPDDAFRWETIALVATSTFGTFFWDRLATAIFAPRIFRIMVDEALATRITDIIPIFTSLFKVCFGFIAISTVNPLLLIGGYYLYNKANKKELGE